MKLALVFLAFAVMVGCSHRKGVSGGGQSSSKNFVLASGWVKDKGNKFDMELTVANQTDKAALFAVQDLKCGRGDTAGIASTDGERTDVLSLTPGQAQRVKVFCINTAKKGAYHVSLARVYANPKEDGVTRGKVVAENIEWVGESN